MKKEKPENSDRSEDSELVALFKKEGDLEVLGELYSRYMPLVYGVCLKYLQDTERAADGTMQIFEDLIDKVGRHDIREFRTWLHSVTKNYCLGILRKEKNRITVGINENVMESDPVLHLFDRRDDERLLERLEECMNRLPEPQKISVRLFFYEDKSYAEICDSTNYNLKSVKSYIQNGKRNLRICLERHGTVG